MDFALMIGGEDYSPSAVSQVAWRLWRTGIPTTIEEFLLRCKQYTEAETLLMGAEVSPRALDDGAALQHTRYTTFPEWVNLDEAVAYQWWIVTERVMIPVFDAFDLMDKLEAREWEK